MRRHRVALIIPTFNAAHYVQPLFDAIYRQTLQPDHILVIDSTSTDNTRELLANYPIQLHTIPQTSFDHGGTRRLAVNMIDADFYVLLSQDALPVDVDCFKTIVEFMLATGHEKVGCAYGRQLPHKDANPLSRHLRAFNYPDKSIIKSLADKSQYGLKTCFTSDSFAIYRREVLMAAGNFPEKANTSEDMYVAAKMLLKGYQVAYVAEACVQHSHNFTLKQEFRRYLTIGIFHRENQWILQAFGNAKSEGKRFVLSELRYLWRQRQFTWMPRAIASVLAKYAGYQLGLKRAKFSPNIN